MGMGTALTPLNLHDRGTAGHAGRLADGGVIRGLLASITELEAADRSPNEPAGSAANTASRRPTQ